jgi:hypothetical protein
MSYINSLFTDCLTSTNNINFDIILSAFSIGDIVSYDDGNGIRCYYLQSFTGTSSGVTNFDTPEYFSGQCESCVSAYCDSMIAYDFVSCCSEDYGNLIPFGIYLPNFSAGTEVIVDPETNELYHIVSASSRGYSYCFINPHYTSCTDAFNDDDRLFDCNMIVRRAFNCCSGESTQQIFVATNLQSGNSFSFSSQCWTIGTSATSVSVLALISSGDTTYSSCTDCLNQTKFSYNIVNCDTSVGQRWVCFDQELSTGQTYQMNVTIGTGLTFTATCFSVIAREDECTSCLQIGNSGTVLTGPWSGCVECQTPPTQTPTVTRTPTPTSSTIFTAVTPTQTNTPTKSITTTRTPTKTTSITQTPTPSRTPRKTPFPTNTPTKTKTPTNTSKPSQTPTKTPTPTQTITRTPRNTPFPTNTPTKTKTPQSQISPTPTKTPTKTINIGNTPFPTNTPTKTQTSSNTPTKTKTPTPTRTKTPRPSTLPKETPFPTNTPTKTQTGSKTPLPTTTVTPTKTKTPTMTKTPKQTPFPTNTPSKSRR